VAHVSAAPEVVKVQSAPGAAERPPAAPARADAPAVARRLATRLAQEWLPRAAWSIHRTGRAGLAGLALLLAAAVFLVSTHLPVAAEVGRLRDDLGAAQRRAGVEGAAPAVGTRDALRPLPARTEMPVILRRVFQEAAAARLAVDAGRYEVRETKRGGVVRYQVTFPVTGPYPRIRAFLDAVLAGMPAVALGDLSLARRSIADGEVEAQIRMTVYTLPAGQAAPPKNTAVVALPARQTLPDLPPAVPAPDRVVPPVHAAALFAQRSWTVLVPVKLAPPLQVAPVPPPDPTAPPFPYTYLGSFAPEGDPPVFFLLRGDRVIDVRIGERLDGVYALESAAAGQLVFDYLPLHVRQSVSAGGSP
jgi:hypothetical protein